MVSDPFFDIQHRIIPKNPQVDSTCAELGDSGSDANSDLDVDAGVADSDVEDTNSDSSYDDRSRGQIAPIPAVYCKTCKR